MVIWDNGPFENEAAADFAGELDDSDPSERLLLLREALQAAVDAEDEVPLDVALRGLAAAAIVAATRPGGPPIESDYAPEFLTSAREVPPQPPDDVVALANDALDRVSSPESAWRAYWDERDGLKEALAVVDVLRDGLTL
jgi:hypothetical protein